MKRWLRCHCRRAELCYEEGGGETLAASQPAIDQRRDEASATMKNPYQIVDGTASPELRGSIAA